MNRLILTIGIALAMAGSAAAQETALYSDIQTFVVDRDTANSVYSTLANYGRMCNVRIAKADGDGTMYCDWSDVQMADLTTLLAGLDPNMLHETWFMACGADWDPDQADWDITVATFRSVNDWLNDEACDNQGPFDNVGSCYDYADASTLPATPWVDPDTMAEVDFWGLPERANSNPIHGWYVSYVAGEPPVPVVVWNGVALDDELIQDLTSDRSVSYVRGLRCSSSEWFNNNVYLRGQWGCPGVAPRLVVRQVFRAGDATGEGCIDGADYTAWADNYGKTDLPAWSAGGWTVGNWTEDDIVDGADYTAWADYYGTGCAGAVPEPATLSLLALAACLPLLRRSQIRRGGRR